MKKQVVKIADLQFDVDIYPRMKIGWLTAYQYAQAMKSGSEFPPVKIGLLDGKKFVVDGWHRIEAKKLLKEEFVEAEIKEYTDRKTIFADAVRFNAAHGRQLSVQEKVRIIARLEEMQFTPDEISALIKVPLEGITKLRVRTISVAGENVYQKSAVFKAGITENVPQAGISARNLESLLYQLGVLLDSAEVVFDTDSLKGLATKVYELLGEKLKLVTV